MEDQVITCPNCKTQIPLTEAISHQIREQLHGEFESEFKKKSKDLREKLEKEATQKAEEAAALEKQDLLAQVAEKDKKLQDARKSELELRKEKRDLEDSKKNFVLEMTKKLDEERGKIKDDALKNAFEEHRLKDLEKEKQIDGMRKQIDELKRKAEQGSQQIQGEVFEDDLEKALRARFPHDCIEPVPKGVNGADVLQKVQEISGLHCGTIIWESKNTKTWSDKWIEKLKDDQCEVKADVAVLMTKVLPKDVSNFEHKKGVWVTDYSSVIGLASALRFGILQVATTKRASEGKNEKIEVLYKYLSSQEFRQKVEAIVEAFSSMKKDLDDEKKAMTKIWAKREKQLDRVSSNTVKIYGDLEGMVVGNLQQIKSLELEVLTDGSDEPEDNEIEDIVIQKVKDKKLRL